MASDRKGGMSAATNLAREATTSQQQPRRTMSIFNASADARVLLAGEGGPVASHVRMMMRIWRRELEKGREVVAQKNITVVPGLMLDRRNAACSSGSLLQ